MKTKKNVIETLRKALGNLISKASGLEKAQAAMVTAEKAVAMEIVNVNLSGEDGEAIAVDIMTREKKIEERSAKNIISGNVRPYVIPAHAVVEGELDPAQFNLLTQEDARGAFKRAGGSKAYRDGSMTFAAWTEGLAEHREAKAAKKVEKKQAEKAASLAPRERIALAVSVNLPSLAPEDRKAIAPIADVLAAWSPSPDIADTFRRL